MARGVPCIMWMLPEIHSLAANCLVVVYFEACHTAARTVLLQLVLHNRLSTWPSTFHDLRTCISSSPFSFSTYSMLRNSASGAEIGLPGRILAGLLPGKNRNRPFGRPEFRI